MTLQTNKALARDAYTRAPDTTPLVTINPSSERPVRTYEGAIAGPWGKGGLAGGPAYARTRGDR
jgi:hypothetical protein